MTAGKRYDYRLVQENGLWSAEIMRRATSTKTVVTKSQGGFASEAEALEWAKKELEAFLQKINEKNRQRALERIPVKNKWDLAKRPAKADKTAKQP